ncbi:MAG: choline dehydrogenase [Pseudomonadota bacterium]
MTESFDYIIVGAGSAGCVLANRMSADRGNRVLLVEAGGRDINPFIHVPMTAGLVYFWRSINWNLSIAPQTHMDKRSIPWPRGKVLGGSSAINGMMYMRGNRRDYDDWAQAGLPGWSYADLLPYFKRSEDNPERAGSAYHGRGGPFHVSRARADNPLYEAFLGAGQACGHRLNDDFNGAEQEGLGVYDFNIRNGRRESTATAFLRPARGRPNLTVWTKTLADRVILENGRATGLRAIRRGTPVTVLARREVILSGGAVNSPGLLERSGIGDPAVLAAAGIEPVVAAPQVGRNLQDHLGVYLTYRCTKPITLYGLMRPDRAALAGIRALAFGKGPATGVPLEAGGFLRTRADLEIPDIHITFVPGLNLEVTQSGQGRHGYLINFYQLRPESRGEVHITNPAPRAQPVIDPNYLAEPADRRCLRDGVRLARRIGASEAFAPYNAGEISPTSEIDSDAAVDDWVRANANTIFHPVGTCRMGADAASVLDPELRVRGVAGLRVADASIMPRIIGGNTSAPTVMIAEKAADLILGRTPPAPEDPARP